MIKIENDCCGCAVPGYPCLGDACPRRNTKVYYCDECGEEIDEAYGYEDEHFCKHCWLAKFRKEF